MQQLKVIPRARLCEELGVSRSTIKRWIESRAAGYCLSFKMTLVATGYKDFKFSCFDIDITQTGSQ